MFPQPFSFLKTVSSGSGYTASATHFDANSDYLSRASFTGAADGKTGILSVRVKFEASGTIKRIFGSTGLDFMLQQLGANTIRFESYGTASMAIMMTSATTITDTAWHHILCAWDSAVAGNNKMYIDRVDATVTINQRNDVVCDYTLTGWNVNAATTGSWSGDIAEVYFAPNQWLDLTNPANVLKFTGSDGKPVSLGSDGTAPIVYLKDAYSTFGTNSGTGGNYTVNGTLTAAATAP